MRYECFVCSFTLSLIFEVVFIITMESCFLPEDVL